MKKKNHSVFDGMYVMSMTSICAVYNIIFLYYNIIAIYKYESIAYRFMGIDTYCSIGIV